MQESRRGKAGASSKHRAKHVQQDLFRRDGKRKGAGRKPKGARAGSPHQTRQTFKPNHPLHVVMRVVRAVGNMRRRVLYKAMRDATIIAALRERIRIVHISIQGTHIHMLVEAKNKLSLARGCKDSRSRPPGTSIRCSGPTGIGGGEDRCLLIATTSR